MKALLAAQQNQTSSTDSSTTATKSRDQALKDLFSQLDTDGDGSISKAEFEDKLGAGGTNVSNADKVFAKLDADGNGSVSTDELKSALKGKGHAAQASGEAGGGGGGGASQQSSATSSTSVTNADGSVTTSITYADGSKVTSTSAATNSASSNATKSYNFIEQLIQRQAAQLQASATSSVSVSA